MGKAQAAYIRHQARRRKLQGTLGLCGGNAHAGGDHTGAGGVTRLGEVGGDSYDLGEVVLHLAVSNEGAAGAASDPSNQASLFELRQHLTQRSAAHPVVLSQLAFAAPPAPRGQRAGTAVSPDRKSTV